jgi:plastocyanin
MPKKNIIIVVVLLVVVIAGGAFWMLRTPANKTDNTSTKSSTSTGQTTTITYGDSGFSPSTVTVHSGDTISIKNDSSRSMQFDSDPHPIHTDDPELNVGAVTPGESMSFTVSQKGTHGYHNHLNPSDKGTIVVE